MIWVLPFDQIFVGEDMDSVFRSDSRRRGYGFCLSIRPYRWEYRFCHFGYFITKTGAG